LYADRLSVNTKPYQLVGFEALAPDKDHKDFYPFPRKAVKNAIDLYQSEKRLIKSTPIYAPAGQSTQMIVVELWARAIETRLRKLSTQFCMKRVYYSGCHTSGR
jgi:predicted DNA-binding helix-hairpin-helix protein